MKDAELLTYFKPYWKFWWSWYAADIVPPSSCKAIRLAALNCYLSLCRQNENFSVREMLFSLSVSENYKLYSYFYYMTKIPAFLKLWACCWRHVPLLQIVLSRRNSSQRWRASSSRVHECLCPVMMLRTRPPRRSRSTSFLYCIVLIDT